MPRLNPNVKLLDMDGNEILDELDKARVPLTVGTVIVRALVQARPPQAENVPPSGKTKFERWLLAKKIKQSMPNPVSISTEEAADIKAVVAIDYGPIVVGWVYDVIENSENFISKADNGHDNSVDGRRGSPGRDKQGSRSQ